MLIQIPCGRGAVTAEIPSPPRGVSGRYAEAAADPARRSTPALATDRFGPAGGAGAGEKNAVIIASDHTRRCRADLMPRLLERLRGAIGD